MMNNAEKRKKLKEMLKKLHNNPEKLLFKKAIIEDEIDVEPWHPIHILVEEHKDIMNVFDNFRRFMMEKEEDPREMLSKTLDYFDQLELYFLKEENGLFPFIEKHGVVQPPAIMWKEHDQLRAWRKELKKFY